MQYIFSTALLLFYSSLTNSQQIIIDRNFLLREKIHTIELVAPISIDWLNEHPAFDTSLNAQWFEFKYNHLGLCTEMKWKFCRINNLQIDTSILSLEHNYYFEYNDTLLTSIHINSFSSIHKIQYQYIENNSLIRKLFFSNRIQTDTVPSQIQPISSNDPYFLPIFPKYKAIYLNNQYCMLALFNKVPLINLFPDTDDVIIYACPILIFVYQ